MNLNFDCQGSPSQNKLKNTIGHGKYRRWNGSTVKISCWADLAQPLARKITAQKLVQPCHFQISRSDKGFAHGGISKIFF